MADTKAMTLAEVRSALTGESAELARRRRAFRRIPSDGLERLTVEIRGRVEPVEVMVLRPAQVDTIAE